jgi:hypothetical protein
MDLTREQREELNALSKELMGTPSRWQKLLERGYYETVTEEKDEEVPGENGAPSTTRKVQVPKLEHGMVVRTIKHHTYESLLSMLTAMKKSRDEMYAAFEKAKAEQEAAQNVQKAAGGSVV